MLLTSVILLFTCSLVALFTVIVPVVSFTLFRSVVAHRVLCFTSTRLISRGMGSCRALLGCGCSIRGVSSSTGARTD